MSRVHACLWWLLRVFLNVSHINFPDFSKLAILKNKAKKLNLDWSVFVNGMFRSGQLTLVMEGLGGRLYVVETTYRMGSFLVLFCAVLGSELLWNCIIKHYKDNCHKIVPFLLIHIIMFIFLFVRIMHDYAEISELCDRIHLLINHDRTISKAL